MTASTIISLVSALLAIAKFLIMLSQKRRWMEQGAADAMLKALQESDDAIAKTKSARDAVRVAIDRDPASVLRDDDGFKRND